MTVYLSPIPLFAFMFRGSPLYFFIHQRHIVLKMVI